MTCVVCCSVIQRRHDRHEEAHKRAFVVQVGAETAHDRMEVRVRRGAQDLGLGELEDPNRDSEEHVLAVEEEPVPDSQRSLSRQRTDERAEEPVERHELDLDAACLKTRSDVRELVRNEPLEHELVSLRSDHRLRVVLGAEILLMEQDAEEPERVLFVHEEQEHAGDEVHRLAIPDRLVVERVRAEDVLELALALLCLFTQTQSSHESSREAIAIDSGVLQARGTLRRTWKNGCSGYVR